MNIKKIYAAFFSATGTTQTIVTTLAKNLSEKLKVHYEVFDFTLPQNRAFAKNFGSEDLVILGTPVYAGRVPNVLLNYLNTLVGGNALALPIVLFGNRNYDDALIELRDILEKDGFRPFAAGAFVGEHSFSKILAAGRPDKQDIQALESFSNSVFKKLTEEILPSDFSLVKVKGTPFPYGGYYQPKDRQGTAIDIRKVKPLTKNSCNNCGLCAELCPMGSINPENIREFTGICIKCGACIKKCPCHAKYYDDKGFLYHKVELEEGYPQRAEIEVFV